DIGLDKLQAPTFAIALSRYGDRGLCGVDAEHVACPEVQKPARGYSVAATNVEHRFIGEVPKTRDDLVHFGNVEPCGDARWIGICVAAGGEDVLVELFDVALSHIINISPTPH